MVVNFLSQPGKAKKCLWLPIVRKCLGNDVDAGAHLFLVDDQGRSKSDRVPGLGLGEQTFLHELQADFLGVNAWMKT